jgi:hypothetical protein
VLHFLSQKLYIANTDHFRITIKLIGAKSITETEIEIEIEKFSSWDHEKKKRSVVKSLLA